MTITAQQCEDAAELLAERYDLTETLGRMRQSKKCRIEYGVEYKGDDNRLHESSRTTEWTAITAPIRKLLQAGLEEQVAAIDARLLALGVEPPSAEEASG